MIWIDNDLCIKCRICTRVCPAGFEMKDGDFVVRDQEASCIEKAISSCPVGAIKTEKDKVKDKVLTNAESSHDKMPGPQSASEHSMGWGLGRGAGRGLGRGSGRGMGMGMGYGRGGRGGKGRGRGGRGR